MSEKPDIINIEGVNITKLTAPFPPNAIKKREGARGKMLDYVEAFTVIRRLNEATNYNWDFKLTRLEWHNDLLMATGELSLPGMGTRTGIGVQKVSERGGEDLVKGASSDSLKKAATLFGVALELYGPDHEEVYQQAQERAAANVSKPSPNGTKPPPSGRGVLLKDQYTELAKAYGSVQEVKDLLVKYGVTRLSTDGELQSAIELLQAAVNGNLPEPKGVLGVEAPAVTDTALSAHERAVKG